LSGTIPLLRHVDPGVALIELNRPGAANRLQPDDLQALLAQLDSLERDPQAHALVLAAHGPSFCGGFDLRALVEGLQSGAPENQGDKLFEAVAERFATTRLITLAAIQGAVVGGATDLALACDLRLGTRDATMLMPAARFGLPLYASALQRYVSRLGVNVAKRLVFLAETIDADEMLRIGFLQELVEPAALRDRALALAARAAAMPAEPLAAMKQVLNASAMGEGTAPAQRAALAAAYEPAAIAARVAATFGRRSAGRDGGNSKGIVSKPDSDLPGELGSDA
jgi:enoyl-CoA hydratase/carnithine racemase